MKTVTKTALANVKQNKGRNILSGIAIGLTTFLIFVILTVGFGMVSLDHAAVNKYYPTWHVMFRGVGEEGVKALKAYDDIESIGLRTDIGQIVSADAEITMLAQDGKSIELNKIELLSGNFPVSERDIVVSEGLLEAVGKQGEIGDEITLPCQMFEADGLGYEEQETFRICGFVDSGQENKDKKLYGALVSMEYARSKIPDSSREYRVQIRLNDIEGKTTDEVTARGLEIGTDLDVAEYNVVDNKEYLQANLVDPSMISGIALIVLVVVCAGILTIYSIYYVSMIPKVQEYGKLKAMGATKRQIRQIVCREGMLVMLVAMPAGLIVSSFMSKIIIRTMFRLADSDQAFSTMVMGLFESGEVPILRVWIYALTIGVVIITVLISLWKPMNKAAKISPVEAMRYEGEKAGKKKQRRGYRDLNLIRLTKANLLRNKRRTAVTVAALGIIGIFYLVVATIISCAKPEDIARDIIEKDYKIKIESWGGDKMNPDRAWSKIQQNNPMNGTFLRQVRNVPGVTEVETKSAQFGVLTDYSPEGEPFEAGIAGFSEKYADILEQGIYKGETTYERLKQGDEIVLNERIFHWIPELKVGDSVRLELGVGDDTVSRTFRIAAVGEYSSGMTEMDFLLPESVLQEINPNNLNYVCEVKVQEEQKDTAYAMLQSLADETGYMKTDNYEAVLAEWEKSMDLISACTYTFLLIIGGIGLMNLANTMINSIYTRKRELGMMQAIGLSEKQLIRMLQMEGLFYTTGMLIISIGIGSAVGYGVYLWAKKDGIFNIQFYHYPVVQVLILAAAVFVIQILLTYLITRSFRKLSLIERVRYAE